MIHLPGTILRFVAITLTGILCALVYGFARVGTLFIRDRERRAASVARLRGRILRRAMTTLGATFIKLGQVMSARPDLFAPELIAELRKLQDQLPAFAFWRAKRILRAELGGHLEDHFAEIDHRAIAAASVAQVHRARLPGGEEVAVKILRPGVRRIAKRDGGILIGLARCVELLRPKFRVVLLVEHLRHFVAGILAQTDLRNEVESYRRFRENFAEVEGIRFPAVYEELSGERVLTMEYVRGTKIDELGPGPHPDLAAITRDVFFKMCFRDGFVHADLHPGNMFVTEERKVVVFDVGLVKKLDDALLYQLVDFSKCVAMGSTEDLVEHLRTFHTYMENPDWDAITRDTQILIDRFRGQRTAELEMGVFINDVFALARKYDTRPVPDMTLLMVGVVTAEGISKMLAPDAPIFEEMAAYLMPIVAKYEAQKASATQRSAGESHD